MFTTLFRIGPLAIFQFVLLASSLATYLLAPLSPCYAYTLLYLALALFLIETILALRLIKQHHSLRSIYVGNRVK